MLRKLFALILGCAALLASPLAWAQGYEVRPWPDRQPAPELTGTDLQGQVWRLADLRGKAVLINFWASWCAPCLAEMPSLQSLSLLHGPDKLVVLAVNLFQKLFLLLSPLFAVCVEAQPERYQKPYLFHRLQKCQLAWECPLLPAKKRQ